MKTTKEYIELLQQHKKEYAENYGITHIGIFGSVARGEQTHESDIDICFEADKIDLFGMGGFMYDLEELLGVRVDIVRMRDNMNSGLKQRIEKDVIYVL